MECLNHWYKSETMQCTLHRYISITDKVKISEQNKSIVTGHFNVRIQFEPIWTFLKCGSFEPSGVSDLPRMSKTTKWIFTYSNGVVCCDKNRSPIALIFQEMDRFAFYAVYINPQDPFSHRTFHIHVSIFTISYLNESHTPQ